MKTIKKQSITYFREKKPRLKLPTLRHMSQDEAEMQQKKMVLILQAANDIKEMKNDIHWLKECFRRMEEEYS